VTLALAQLSEPLGLLSAWLLGIVEGLTEFVPVSSTGHLILVSRGLGLSGPAVNSFSVVIQLGALLAAVAYYRRTLIDTAVGTLRREPKALALFRNLVLAALPLLIVGYLAGKWIKARLFAPLPVAGALVVGGVVMLLVDLWARKKLAEPESKLYAEPSELSPLRAVFAGLIQTLALWPGTSRSMASIVGAELVGLSPRAAADFAFLLALPTLGTATLYELQKEGALLLREVGLLPLAVGLLTSFVIGWVVIAGFLRILSRHGLWAFSLYRIVFGILLLCLL
jgi:undecaprenyl-diphosphatase